MADPPSLNRRTRLPWKGFVAGLVVGVLVSLAALALLAPVALQHRGDLPLERTLAALVKDRAVPDSAAALQPPAPLTGARMLARGREAYTGSCSACHGATGDGRGQFGAALYPDASDLRAAETQGKSDGQLFWIVKNGLSFVGMPSFGGVYDDEEIWSLVAYVRALGQGGAAAAPLDVPRPGPEDLAFADPWSDDPAARGAATYHAMGCVGCHGARGASPARLALAGRRDGIASVEVLLETVRDPPIAMPRFDPSRLPDREVEDLYAYIKSFPAPSRPAGRG